MKDSITPCNDEQLRLLLGEEVDSVDYRVAAGHLEVCPSCQQRLGELAGEKHEWDEISELLNAHGSDRTYALEQRERASLASDNNRRAASWSEATVRPLLAPPSHPEMLGRLGRYEVERLIGAGGMGIVLKGFDTELHRPVAIKILSPHLAHSGAARQRFAREARAAAAVVHEHVVAIHNVETDEKAPFLVMQYVAGESLQQRLDRQGPLTVTAILRIACQTAAGLAAAHAQGLVHRDVKPSNILLEEGVDRALLTDFGLARASDDASLTHTGNLPGTPHYMSPEQARGEPIDARSDLFSLGSVIYAMCTGRPPFRADSSLGVLRRIIETEPRPIQEVNASVPEWLAAIVEWLHNKSPAHRPDSAAKLATRLETCLAHVQQPTAVPLPEECLAIKRAASLKASTSSQRQLNWPPTLPARITSQQFLKIAGVTAILLIGGVVTFMWLGMGRKASTPANDSSLQNIESVSSANPGAESHLPSGWNDVTAEVDSLLQDAGKSLPEIEKDWLREPLPVHEKTNKRGLNQPPKEQVP